MVHSRDVVQLRLAALAQWAVPFVWRNSSTFRGSLGAERHGHEEFWRYVEEITGPLADYRCDEITSVSDDHRVFARMRFGGRHVGEFRGFAPTGEMVEWQGAALFEIDSGLIISVWVLGDLTAVDALLDQQGRRSR